MPRPLPLAPLYFKGTYVKLPLSAQAARVDMLASGLKVGS